MAPRTPPTAPVLPARVEPVAGPRRQVSSRACDTSGRIRAGPPPPRSASPAGRPRPPAPGLRRPDDRRPELVRGHRPDEDLRVLQGRDQPGVLRRSARRSRRGRRAPAAARPPPDPSSSASMNRSRSASSGQSVNISSNWSTTTTSPAGSSESSRPVSSASGCSPGHDSTVFVSGSRSRNAGTSPARSSEDFPVPDARTGDERGARQSSARLFDQRLAAEEEARRRRTGMWSGRDTAVFAPPAFRESLATSSATTRHRAAQSAGSAPHALT